MIRFEQKPRQKTITLSANCAFHPAVNITESDDSYNFEFEIPGIEKEDVRIWVEKDMLIISGEKKSNPENKNIRRMSERRFGKFERSFWLPNDASRDEIKASYDKGLLFVSVSKKPESKPKIIDIS